MATTEDTAHKTWISAYVDPELRRQFRILCAEREVSMSEQLEKLMASEIKKANAKKARDS